MKVDGCVWGVSWEDFNLQSSKANITLFCCLLLLLLELFVHGHRPKVCWRTYSYTIQKIFAEINIFKLLQGFLIVPVVLCFMCLFLVLFVEP